MARSIILTPVVSKIYCSFSPAVLMVRKRPVVTNGGGFVVVNSSQKVVFTVDGCRVLGVSRELLVRDAAGEPVLFICNKDGVVQALSFHSWWNGYRMGIEGPKETIFKLREPRGFRAINDAFKISIVNMGLSVDYDYVVKGSFRKKDCTINDRRGDVVAQVGGKGMASSEDFYYVVVTPGFDLAFVVGVIAVLDNIHGESTMC